jgi:hypothetical protein
MTTTIGQLRERLQGVRVRLQISDPWDFGTAQGTAPLHASIAGVTSDPAKPDEAVLLIRLATPLEYKGTTCEYFIALPRRAASSFEELRALRPIESALTGVSTEEATSSDPFDPKRWRGGVALLGSIALL